MHFTQVPILAYWKEALMAGAFGIAMLALLAGRVPAVRLRRAPNAMLFGLLAIVIFGFRHSVNTAALAGAVGLLIYVAAYYAATLAFDRQHLLKLVRALAFPATIVAAGAIVQVTMDPTLWGMVPAFMLGTSTTIRAGSLLGSSIILAPYLAMSIVMHLALLMTARRVHVRWIIALAIGVQIIALVNTWSRGGWFQLTISVAIFLSIILYRELIVVGRRKIVKTVALGMWLVSVASIIYLFRGQESAIIAEIGARVASALNWTSSEDSNILRLSTWLSVLAFIGQDPWNALFGSGLGEGWMFSTATGSDPLWSPYRVWMEAQGLPAVTESYWLLLLLNIGIVGTAIYFGIIMSILRKGMRSSSWLGAPAESVLLASLVANVVGMVIAAGWYQSLTSVFIGPVFWLQCAALGVLSDECNRGGNHAGRAVHATVPDGVHR
jgi:hypothetical protein